MERMKENAKSDFIKMIHNSWTYDRLTEQERDRLDRAFMTGILTSAIYGTYDQRRKILDAVYNAFLQGVGYDGPTWREPDPESIPF